MVKATSTSRKNRWILLLILVLAGLVGLSWYLRQADLSVAAARVLLPAEQARTIDILTDEQLISLAKSESSWHLIHPIDAIANQDRVYALLSLLVLPDSHRYTKDEVDLNELGLTAPVASIRINDIEFSLGATGTRKNTRYVRVNNEIYLLDDLIYPLVKLGTEGFRAQAPISSNSNTGTQ